MGVEKNKGSRFLVIAIGLLCLIVAMWDVGGKRILNNFVNARSQPWAVFHVPASPTILTGLEANVVNDSVTICNRSDNDWNNVLVQIDQGYLARLERLRAEECNQISVHDFATESWKRMPPPRDLQVTRVAVLTQVPQNGYAQLSQLEPRSQLHKHE